MKTPISLSIKTPCTEKWSDFTTTSIGGYCDSCCKEVIDFTRMTDREVMNFFKTKPAKTCGRFRTHQLKTYSEVTQQSRPSRFSWMQTGVLTVSLLVASKEGFAGTSQKVADPISQFEANPRQEETPDPKHKVSGVVKEKGSVDLLPGVSIYLKGSSLGTVTNLDGKFTFPQELEEGDVLIFSFIGYKSSQYIISKQDPIILDMELELSFEVTMGEVSVNEPYSASAYGRFHVWQRIKSLF